VDKSARVVRAMFNDIARTYDGLNHGLSANQDKRWRRRAVTLLGPRAGDRVLDVCCGTGDLALEIARRQPRAQVFGTDFAAPMLHIARAKSPVDSDALSADRWALGDALRLPFEDAAFDSVSVAFGVRNFEDTLAGVRELARVLRPGGKLLVLEFMRPTSALVMRFFGAFNALLSPIGEKISGHESAYKYLPQSVGGFYTRHEFERLLRGCDLRDVRSFDYSGGVATAFLARKA
jgi:demethylmenaquinone methyltransferase/2-methoxy-6-polyprenyl-1,4-benzoquinol methylase